MSVSTGNNTLNSGLSLSLSLVFREQMGGGGGEEGRRILCLSISTGGRGRTICLSISTGGGWGELFKCPYPLKEGGTI